MTDSKQAETNSLEIEVTRLLHRIGVPAHIKGHEYLRIAIILAVEYPDKGYSMTKYIYPEIARRFSVSYASVERAMRTAVELSWDRGDITLLSELFEYTISCEKGKPTNYEFVSLLADRIRIKRA
ncbi:MAG: sporulation initiation factor Spo0A C-terminal domain-containing protein [Clostridia bacterium]|nr:sporulation initiation factor Spo0A C-terminal domain-containing protein [Clostridia bacterium]